MDISVLKKNHDLFTIIIYIILLFYLYNIFNIYFFSYKF